MTYNVILLADTTEVLYLQKSIGPYKVANALRTAGFDVLVVNHLHIFSIDEIKLILKHAINDKTLFVGVSPFFYRLIENPEQLNADNHEKGGTRFHEKEIGSYLPHGIKYNQEIRALIKELNPNCKIVLGGPEARDSAHTKDYDYVVLGYAETSVVDLANHLATNVPLNNSRRSIHRNIIVDDSKALGYNFVSTQMTYADHDFILPNESLTIEIGRGCIFSCTFCSFPLIGKKKNDHVKLEEVLLAEFLENYQRFGTTRYIFGDDTFNDSREKVEMIHRISKKLPFQLEYWAYIRVDLLAAHIDTVDLLYESGLRAAYFGIETLHPKAAAVVGKGGVRKKIVDTVNYIKNKYGNKIMLNGTFIFGLPNEPVSSMLETAELLTSGMLQLDTWGIYPLFINESMAFSSKFDREYAKYGYTVLERVNDRLVWKNEFTDYYECEKLAIETNAQGIANGVSCVSGLDSFYISGLDFDLSFSMCKKVIDFEWHQVDLRKQERAKIYKKKLFEYLNIDAPVV